MNCPAAPYHETVVQAEVEKICAEQGLACARDRYGNIQVHTGADSTLRPIVLAAHLDHPGFDFIAKLRLSVWRARFLGGVPDSYFKAGTRLRVFPGDRPGLLKQRIKEKEFEIEVEAGEAPRFAVWDLPAYRLADGRITGRACDDLIGASAILAVLIQLRKVGQPVIGLLSRAEEVGFQGALVAAHAGLIPKDALVISLETSRELPPVKIGQGVIIRIGDRASVFDHKASRFLADTAAALQKRDKGFLFQRALMSGGTCEGTAFQEYGFQTGALCVALGNYHNCGAKDRIAAEFVSQSDAEGMVRLLVAAVRGLAKFEKSVSALRKRLEKLRLEGERRLSRS